MLNSTTLPPGPLYDPKSKIRKFRFEEDFENIRLNLEGTGALYTDPKFVYYLGDDKEWRRPKEICSRPFFIDGKPDRFDAIQGSIGDCWLASGIEALTLNDTLNQHVVPPDQSFDHNYVGAFHFRIWQLGTWYDVVVDDRLPVYKNGKTLCYIHSMRGNVFWAALLEKAYGKICGTSTVSYESLRLGYPMTSLQDLSGGIVERIKSKYPPSGTTTKWLINEVFSKDALMCLQCYNIIQKDTHLVATHGYTITNVFKCSDDDPDYPGLFLVRIMNPWGHTEWKGDWSDDDYNLWRQIDRATRQKLNFVIKEDGEFWMNENDFVNFFERIWICHLGPGQYQESRRGMNFKTWRTTAFSGEWIKNISAVGSELEKRHKNPQYRIILEFPENDINRNLLCSVVIELTQRSKFGRDIRPKIGFYVYKLNKVKTPSIPLNKKFFKNNEPLFKPVFSKSDGRAYLTSLTLELGKYCIVPCTELKNKESQFLLRVFSESRIELWEYDTQISKCPPTEKNENEHDKELQRLFNEIAQDQNEIDWMGLKEILETAMNPKTSYFWMIASFLKFIKYVFKNFFSLSCNGCDPGDVVFTKDECRSMIAMLDHNHSGKLSFPEFSNLWNKICFWTTVYEQQLDETEGYVTVGRLRDALSYIGYNINTRTVHSLSYVYANDQGYVFLSDFILCGIKLETVLALACKEKVEGGDKITFSLEEWVKKTLIL